MNISNLIYKNFITSIKGYKLSLIWHNNPTSFGLKFYHIDEENVIKISKLNLLTRNKKNNQGLPVFSLQNTGQVYKITMVFNLPEMPFI